MYYYVFWLHKLKALRQVLISKERLHLLSGSVFTYFVRVGPQKFLKFDYSKRYQLLPILSANICFGRVILFRLFYIQFLLGFLFDFVFFGIWTVAAGPSFLVVGTYQYNMHTTYLYVYQYLEYYFAKWIEHLKKCKSWTWKKSIGVVNTILIHTTKQISLNS